MDGAKSWKTLLKMDDLGENPPFSETPISSYTTKSPWKSTTFSKAKVYFYKYARSKASNIQKCKL